MPGWRPIVSPEGKVFAVFAMGADEEDRPTIHVGNFGTRLVEIEGLAGVFLDEERILVVRRKRGVGTSELAEVHPFVSGEPVWTRDVPRLAPGYATLAFDARTETVFVRGKDQDDGTAYALRTAARQDAPFAPIPSWDGGTIDEERDEPVTNYIGPAGAGDLVLRREGNRDRPRPVAPWRRRATTHGTLWLMGPDRGTLLSSSIAGLSCAHPIPGDSSIWCLPGGELLRPTLLRVDTQRAVIERVPARIPFANGMSALDPSHLALLRYAELRVIDLDTRRGARLFLPEGKNFWHHSLIDGALAVFHREGSSGRATISVYKRPVGK